MFSLPLRGRTENPVPKARVRTDPCVGRAMGWTALHKGWTAWSWSLFQLQYFCDYPNIPVIIPVDLVVLSGDPTGNLMSWAVSKSPQLMQRSISSSFCSFKSWQLTPGGATALVSQSREGRL